MYNIEAKEKFVEPFTTFYYSTMKENLSTNNSMHCTCPTE